MPALATVVFLGAFLLFQVQPLLAKYVLPAFGGAPSVWTTAMLFFQGGLLAGYGYAHVLNTRLSVRHQVLLHGGLVGAAFLFLPVIPDLDLETAVQAPTATILVLLVVTVGLPYLVLASTSPLMQAWAATIRPGKSPYRLYALSNAASLLALVSYPFLIEPLIGRTTQAWVWSAGFLLFSTALVSVFYKLWHVTGSTVSPEWPSMVEAPRPSPTDMLLWLLWPATGSIFLLSITNEITQDVAVVPFFWVLPLAVYLFTFVVTFDRDAWYHRGLFMTALPLAFAGMIWMMFRAGTASVIPLIAVLVVGLFICCMVCHGELARLRPHASRLTTFYLFVAAGGVLGGVFTAVVAPALFSMFLEIHIAIGVCAALTLVTVARDRTSRLRGLRPVWAWVLVAAGYVILSMSLTRHVALAQNAAIDKSRNFYGVLTVLRLMSGTGDEHLAMRNGMIDHGVQLLDPEKRHLPTTYYGASSGLAVALTGYPIRTGRRIGVVGLGVGTVAAYGRAGDTIRVYEINPEVTRLARLHFTYLEDTPADLEIVHGDGRRSLEAEQDQRFNVLVLDAFSGDAIPVHLLTREAFATYARHLSPDGVLVVNMSNRHVDIEPVVRSHATELRYESVSLSNSGGPNLIWHATWIVLTNNQDVLEALERHGGIRWDHGGTMSSAKPWTDDFANVLGALKGLDD